MLCALYSLSHLNPHKSLGGRYYQYLYFQSKRTETQREMKMSKSHSKELMILECKPRKSDSVSFIATKSIAPRKCMITIIMVALHRAYDMPDTVLGASHILTYQILTVTLR